MTEDSLLSKVRLSDSDSFQLFLPVMILRSRHSYLSKKRPRRCEFHTHSYGGEVGITGSKTDVAVRSVAAITKTKSAEAG